MAKFEYLEFESRDHDIKAVSTDTDSLNWIAEEAKRLIPDCRIETGEFQGQKWRIYITHLQGKQHAIFWWIMRELGSRGWEPFIASFASPGNCYFFRRESASV
jgi:hypothetical protein